MKLETKKLNKPEFLHLLARRAGFTYGDTKIFFQAFEDLLTEAIETKTEINIHALFDIYYTTVSARTMKNPKTSEPVDLPETIRVECRLGKPLRAILKAGYGKMKR
jgi:nucleoid DNA-binding protein